jgi:hypothetical protein
MAAYDVLREIVRNGSDLTIANAINYDVLRELAALAKSSGAKLTITTHMNYDVIRQLSSQYGKSVGFIDGLDKFEKE